MVDTSNPFKAIIDALDPVIEGILDVIPFPLNAVIGFIWGGIAEVIGEILFG